MKLTSLILLLIYGLSTFASVGVLYCKCTQSQQVVVLSALPSCCPCNGADNACCSHNESHDEKTDCGSDEDCHSLTYQYSEVDQMTSQDGQSKIQMPVLSIFLATDVDVNNVKEYDNCNKNRSPLFVLSKIPLIYTYCQLRL